MDNSADEGVQLSEDLDFNNLVPCPKCKKPIPSNATLCLYCGEDVSFTQKQKPWIIWTAILMVALLLALALTIT